MTEHNQKPDYNEQYSQQYNNTFADSPSYLPANYDYDRRRTDAFYENEESSNAGSFLMGALVGGVIGAATALFLAPKTGSEMRSDFTEQASQLKDKSIEISTVAKQKAGEFTSTAKEKTGGISKTLQEQSGQIVDKVKNMTSKTTAPMDDGTASSEGEEAIDFVESALEKGKDKVTATAEAMKEAADKKTGDLGKTEQSDVKNQTTANSDVAYDNSDNKGENKVMNQNQVSDEKPKKS